MSKKVKNANPDLNGEANTGKKKRKHKKLRMFIAISIAVTLCGAGLGVGLLFIPKEGLNINEGYASVSYEVQEGEVYSTGADYSGLDIFGKLNWTFQQKDEWYASFHSMVSTTVDQDVRTIKQFRNGMLISADISRSSLVNLAREFCYIPAQDRVIWREAAGGPSTYNGFDTPWETGEPRGNMTISGPDGFKAKNGLPATELSVYIFRDETVLETETVVQNADGTYTVTYHLNPEVWETEDGTSAGAAAYYCNQMKFTGGLTDVPTFDKIEVSFTFNENWEVLKTTIHEEYSATMGFTVGCSADSVTEYSYTTPFAPISNAYEEYFHEYADKEATGAPEPTIDNMSALTAAFAPVINGPTTLSLDLTVNGKPVEGLVYIDLHTNGALPNFGSAAGIADFINKLEVRAKLGSVGLYVQGGAAYLSAGDIKVKLTLGELTDLLGGIFGGSEAEGGTEPEGGADPLAALMDAELVHEAGSGKASAHAELDLGGVVIPIDFNYFIDEKTLSASLDNVQTAFSLQNIGLSARLGYSSAAAPAPLTGAADYSELSTHIQNLIGLFGADVFHADIAYEGYGITVGGGIDIAVKGDLKVSAALTVNYGEETKRAGIGYESGMFYLDLDGVKLSADQNAAAALLKEYLPQAETTETGNFSLSSLIDTLLFTTTLTDNIAVSGNETALQILVKADALLKAFGFDLGNFELGTVKLGVAGKQITVEALGARLSVRQGEAFTVEKDGYSDAMYYVEQFMGLFGSDLLHADVSYEGYGLEVTGGLDLNVKDLVAAGNFTISYGEAEKPLTVIYKDDILYLNADGLKLSANVQDAIAFVQGILGAEAPAALAGETGDRLEEILTLLFSFRFGDVLKVGDTQISIDGTKLFAALGIDFEPGNALLTVEGEALTAEVLGATVTVKAGAPFTAQTTGYADIVDYAEAVAGLVQGGYLAADLTYEGYGLTVAGNLDLNIKRRIAEGNFTLTYGEAQKQLNVIYKNDQLYLGIDGLKLSAEAKNVLALAQNILGSTAPEAAQSEGAVDVLAAIFSFRFSDLITIEEEGNTLDFAVQGTELLKAFGVDFALGPVDLAISKEGTIDLQAIGATVALKAGTPFTVITEGYIDFMDYAVAVAGLISGNYLVAGVTYSGYGLEVEGRLNLDIHELSAKGKFTVTYGEAKKALSVVYKEDVVYLEVDGLKLSANAKDAVAFVQGILGAEEPAALEEEGVADILAKLFSFNFSDLIKAEEEGAGLNLVVQGTELLKVFGVEFDLGPVAIRVTKSGTLTAEALGATITVKSGPKFKVATDGYTDIMDYVEAVAALVQGGYLKADLSYSGYGLNVTGKLDLDINSLVAQGNFTIAYGEAEKQLTVIYENDQLYLGIDGLKFSANVQDAVAFVQGLLGAEAPAALAEETGDRLEEILTLLFSFRFGDILTVGEEGTTLNLAVQGTALLKALGVDFNLGTVDLAITKDGTITAKAADLGVTVGIEAGAPFTVTTDGYIDIVDYAEAVAGIIQGSYLKADLSYEGYGLTVAGKLDLDIKDFNNITAEGTFTLVYGKINKQITVAYTQNGIYLTLDGLKLKTDAAKAIEIVENILVPANSADPAAEMQEKSDLDKVLEKIFAFHFGDMITVTEANNTVSLAVQGTELLAALGVEFDLGQVTLDITKAGEITVQAAELGANITVKEGGAFTPKTEGFTELTPVLAQLPALLNAKVLALKGTFFVLAGDTEIALEIKNGVFSWSEGLNLYLDADLSLGTTALPIMLHVTQSEVQANVCGMGMQLEYSDLPMLENAIVSVYQRIYKIASEMFVEGTTNPLPDIRSFDDLLNLLKGTAVAAAALEGAAEQAEASFDWTELLQSIVIGASTLPGGIAHAEYQGVNVDILNQIDAGGFIGLVLGYTAETFSVTADLGVTVYTGELPELPAPDLTAAEVENFLGYLGSAIELFETTDLTLTLDGKVTSTDATAYPPAEGEEFGTKYDIHASMSTHRGASNLIHLDVDGNHLWVDADVFAHASINITATNPADSSLFIDLFILDGAPAKAADGSMTYTQDGMLDFYVTLSQFGDVNSTAETVPGYNPVRLYAPSQEILTILSSALPMFGIDVEILNNYMVNYWLSLENVSQLKALGSLVLPLLGENVSGTIGQVNSLFAKLGSLFTSSEKAEAAPAALAETDMPAGRKTISAKDYLKELTVGADGLTITLNSQAIYGMEGLKDVQAVLTKDADVKDENGAYTYGKFHTLNLLNIYDKTGTLNTSLNGTVSYGTVETTVPAGEYQSFLGADKLILALAKSATHGVGENGEVISGEAEPHHYVLNNNFYIDGSISITANLLIVRANINIRLIALSVTIDENGALGINIRLEYDGVYNVVSLIDGDSTVDITIKNGLVYMKRVQTSKRGLIQNELIDPITIYRVAPLSGFTADILDHLAFILNFSDTIANALGSATGSGSSSSTSAKVDFGKRLSDVLSAYTFEDSADGATWDLTLNGDALVKGVLGDLNVKITQDTDGFIRTITADTKVVSIITATVNLRWRNAGGTMEAGVTDQTHDIAVEDNLADEAHGFGGMMEKLLAQGWGTEDYVGFASFLEGQRQTVTFKHSGTNGEETLGSQDVIASTGADGATAKTLYSSLTYPDVSAEKYAPADDTQVMGWAEVDPGEVLPSDNVIWTQPHGHPCKVTFRSETELGNEWQYNEAESKWYYEAEMWYNAKIVLGDTELTVTQNGMVVDLWEYAVPEFVNGAREGHWQKNPEIASEGAAFVAEYDPDHIVYHSEVAFTVKGVVKNAYELSIDYGTDHTVYEPTAKGYTFLGWYEQQDGGAWSKVEIGTVYTLGEAYRETTLQALWVSDLSVTLTKSVRRNKQVEGRLIKTTYYDYDMEAVISGGKLIGAFADKATLELTYSFDAFTDNTFIDDVREIGREVTENYPTDGKIAATKGHVQSANTPRAHVQIRYTYNGAEIHNTGDVIVSGEWVDG